MRTSSVIIGHLYRSFSTNISIAVIGSGPAGFYCTQHLLKVLPTASVDIYEKLPVPYGLVRFGVAPDHSEVKNVINTFSKIALNPRVKFIGNVSLGKDVSLKELCEFYHSVILAYGADGDIKLGIPGENLRNVMSARHFVGWYNGLPNMKDIEIDLQTETAVIVGQGNVAIDVARILLKSPDELKHTDITEYALNKLGESKIKHVHVVGRRGPLQVAFTIKEFREMVKLQDVQTFISKDYMDDINLTQLSRPRKRLTELMINTYRSETKNNAKKYFHVTFLRSPIEIVGSTQVTDIKFVTNTLKNAMSHEAVIESKLENYILSCNLVLKSIGYRCNSVDPDIVINKHSIQQLPVGVYSTGWLSSGPEGVILTTMTNAFEVANVVAKDIENGKVDIKKCKDAYSAVHLLLQNKGIQVVSWTGWEKIDAIEKERGKLLGKPREKIVNIYEMLEIAQ